MECNAMQMTMVALFQGGLLWTVACIGVVVGFGIAALFHGGGRPDEDTVDARALELRLHGVVVEKGGVHS